MNLRYYLRNVIYGLMCYVIIVFILRNDVHEPVVRLIIGFSFVNTIFFPFAKRAVETVALKYSTIDDWTKGANVETPAKNGVYAIYYMVIFAVTIPVAIIYLIYFFPQERLHKSGLFNFLH